MAGKRLTGAVISLEERRQERRTEAFSEMIEAEHALFVALRLVEQESLARQLMKSNLRKNRALEGKNSGAKPVKPDPAPTPFKKQRAA